MAPSWRLAEQRESRRRFTVALLVGMAALAVLLLISYIFAAKRVDAEADRVAQGHTSNGLGYVVPFIDVRANLAHVTWLGEKDAAPPGLVQAPYLTYLGSGEDATVLVACGERTYIVQNDDVLVTLLGQGRAAEALDEAQQDGTEATAFKKACGDRSTPAHAGAG